MLELKMVHKILRRGRPKLKSYLQRNSIVENGFNDVSSLNQINGTVFQKNLSFKELPVSGIFACNFLWEYLKRDVKFWTLSDFRDNVLYLLRIC